MNSDILIIGGGIIGLYSAALLVNTGASITVIDQSDIGNESSWAAGGILSPLLPWDYAGDTHDLTDQASIRYEQLANQLKESTGIDIEFWPCGLVTVQNQRNPSAESWCQKHSVPFDDRCPSTIAAFKPSKNKSYMFLPEVAQVRCSRLVSALYKDLKLRGVAFLPHTQVHALEIENSQVIGAQTKAGLIQTHHLVWATGAWGGLLNSNSSLISPPKITPVRGQIIAYDGKKIGLNTILYDQGHYLIPRKDGLILAGSTLEHVGFDKSTTESARHQLVKNSTSLIPKLADCRITQHWSGLRPYAEIKQPLIGSHSQIKGLYLNCGHFRYGIAMAPRSAEIILQAISKTEAGAV
jgi:glycine oxidase